MGEPAIRSPEGNDMRLRQGWTILAIAGVLVVPGMAGATVDIRAPFTDQGDAFTDYTGNCLGYGIATHHQSTGSLNLYLEATGCVDQDQHVYMGGRYITHSGETLSSFAAHVTVSATARGHFTCSNLNGNSLGQAKWDIVSKDAGVEHGRVNLHTWTCASGSVSASLTDSATMQFDAGTDYQLMGDLYEHTRAGGGSASIRVDFCGDGTFDGGSNPCSDTLEGIRLSLIHVDNAVPVAKARHHDDVWLPLELAGITVSGVACDYDGAVKEAHVAVDGYGQGDTTGSDVCLSASKTFTPLALPASYRYCAWGKDDETTASPSDCAYVNVVLIPALLGASVPGYPDLSSIPNSAIGATARIETIVAADNSVRAYRVTSGLTTLMDTMQGTLVGAGERLVTLDLDRVAQHGAYTINGAPTWSGSTSSTGSAWWQVGGA
jgi:hypothetical protein